MIDSELGRSVILIQVPLAVVVEPQHVALAFLDWSVGLRRRPSQGPPHLTMADRQLCRISHSFEFQANLRQPPEFFVPDLCQLSLPFFIDFSHSVQNAHLLILHRYSAMVDSIKVRRPVTVIPDVLLHAGVVSKLFCRIVNIPIF